jgi:penicillin-binding protein 1A
VIGLAGLVSLLSGLAIGSWNTVCRDCPSIAQIYTFEPLRATKILDHDGKLIDELFKERRTPTDIKTLPEHVKHAFIAVEDRRFYSHNGFDFRGIARAASRRLLLLGNAGGGSTITQQLARNMFQQEVGFERSGMSGLRRKLKEVKVALDLEGVYEKDQILEAYINLVNYGDGHYGIEAASQYFFGKPATQLNVAEGALLAAVVNAPTRYSPFRNPDRARSRRNGVLRRMEDQGYITRVDRLRYEQEPLPEAPHRGGDAKVAPYFVEWVRGQLDDRYGDDLYTKGYTVVTTLDLEMQQAAELAMAEGWKRIEEYPGFRGPKYEEVIAQGGSRNASETEYVQGLFIAMDPATGDVRALIGGRDFKDSKFNRAVQSLRQPGSTFKPFTYAAAIASGIPASHVIHDSPVFVDLWDGSVYSPKNFDPDFRGPLTLRNALKHSVNTVTVKLGQAVGLETVAQTAKQMGIQTPIDVVASMPIGASSVIPLQITEAYSTFANGGSRAVARSILRVQDAAGRVLWETQPETHEALSVQAAAITRDLLRTAIDNGTGESARGDSPTRLPYEIPAGGKTGTTNDATDTWFIGFTPNLLATVWFGFDRPKQILRGSAATGGGLAAPSWGQFMRSVYYGETPELPRPTPWTWPEGITSRVVDAQTGKLAGSCPDVYVEYFIEGTEPTDTCDAAGSGGLFGPLRGRFPPDTMRGRRDTLDARRGGISRHFRF